MGAARFGDDDHRRLDPDTAGHVIRVATVAERIALLSGLEADAAEEIGRATRLHDIGKIGISDKILNKPGELTTIERREIERHAVLGYKMLSGTGDEFLELAATIALTHHERFDGTGYPHRLTAEAIPMVGRIAAIADVFDALTSDRAYRDALTPTAAIEVLVAERGLHFDPVLLDLFVADLSSPQSPGCVTPRNGWAGPRQARAAAPPSGAGFAPVSS